MSVAVDGATINVRIGGAGEPLLLLHGYPETHAMWHGVARDFAKTYRVIVPDLRGYGDSVAYQKDYSFRAMAADQIAVMRHLGYAQFHVISHDRGARVAHRMVLDHPIAVKSIVLLDILPTLDVWRTMDDWLAKRYYHWMFLAQPGGMPEALINSDPVMFLHSALTGLAGQLEDFAPAALADYEKAARNPAVVAAWCGDYAAGAGIDLEHDKASLGQSSDIPCLVLWGNKGVVGHHLNPIEAWQVWFPNALGSEIDAGHFLVEERPDEVMPEIRNHLATSIPKPSDTTII
ncbi:MAG: alpha/beta hydrolase [Pseudoruegeria sp.]